jgi:putative membrane protein insertion efficiency factor
MGVVKIYQWTISPLLGHHCRFFPSCSQYMLEAIETYGIVRGLYLGSKRLLRCHPFCKGGVDLLPTEKQNHD